MSSKPNNQRSHKEQKKSPSSTSVFLPGAANPQRELYAEELLPAATAIPQREVSAEEILQASIHFKSSHSESSLAITSDAAISDQMLYPAIDYTPCYAAAGEEKQEEAVAMAEEEKQEEGVIIGAAATVPTFAVYIENDDPAMRKIMEEERMMNHARMKSMMASNDVVVQPTSEDSKPSAQAVAYASITEHDVHPADMDHGVQAASITEHDVHPADMDHGVQAELVGEADYSPQHAVAIPAMPTIAMAHDDYMTDEAAEAIVLDSKPAAAPPGWDTESAEATVLGDSTQHQAVWTTHQEESVFEDIAVTGRDEDEATVVDIAEDVHPADFDAPGVQAELIGREYSHCEALQGNQSWAGIEEPVAVADTTTGYAVALATGVVSTEVYDVIASGESQATIVSITEDVHPADIELPGVQAEFMGGGYSHGESLQLSQVWADDQQVAVSDHMHNDVVATAADITSADAYDDFTSGEAQATIVDIREDVHPADIELPGVQAEFIGGDYSHGESRQLSQIWEDDQQVAVSDHMHNDVVATAADITSAEAYDDFTSGEAQATIVDIREDVHPADIELPGVQAEFIRGDYSHGESLQLSQVWADDQQVGVSDVTSANAYDDFTSGEAQATIVDIREDANPVDMEVPGVQAEFVGRDYGQGELLQGTQVWVEPGNQAVAITQSDGYAVATATNADRAGDHVSNDEAQATVVEFFDDVHPSALVEGPGVQAELVERNVVRAVSLQETQLAQALLVVSPAEHSERYSSAPDCHARLSSSAPDCHARFADDPNDTPAMSRDGLAALDTSSATPVKVIPPPPPMPARSRLSNPSASYGAGVTGVRPAVSAATRSTSTGSATTSVKSIPPPPPMPARSRFSNPSASYGAGVTGVRPAVSAATRSTSTGSATTSVKSIPPPPPMPARSRFSNPSASYGPLLTGARPVGIGATRNASTGSARNTSTGSGLSRNTSTGSGLSRNTSNGSSQNSGELLSQAQRAMNRSRTHVMRHTNNVMERLFGGDGDRHSTDFDLGNAAGSILPRTLLPWSVFRSETTGMWVATVNTNQKALDNNDIAAASKALRAFSVPTKGQAEALARAWAPPRMLPFSDNNRCFICESRFAVFKRPCHCRNCGVCICSACSVQWPSKMIPDTYNIKQESIVNSCKSCDWLCSAFRMAMLDGNFDRAVAIYSTGNLNLVTPFANVKGELL